MNDLRKLETYTVDELMEKETEAKVALQRLRLSHAIEALKNPMKIRKQRRLVAQIKTVCQQKRSTKPSV